MITGVEIQPLILRTDDRGWLLKLLMRHEIDDDAKFGEIYLTAAEPGEIKGQHYHKECTEWFCVIRGYGKLVLIDPGNGERQEINMGEEDLVRVKIPPLVVHGIQNTGHELMVLLAYSDRPYNHNHPDTFPVAIRFD